jgi:membrane protease YdiL (CAAX protease family)
LEITPIPRAWAGLELVLAASIIVAGLLGYIPISSTPWLIGVAAICLWWRGPGWRGIGLRRPPNVGLSLAIGVAVGVGYQFLGLYVIEPVIARMTSGELPDVSAFRSLVGNEALLAFWLAMSWTLAAFMEEVVYRGWLTNRVAELWRFSTNGWIAGVLVSSALFGAVHLYQGASGMIATGLSGLVFGGVYLATGRNLWASVLAHGFMDTVGFLMIYFGVYPGL